MARSWGLFLTTWVFQIFWQVLVVLLIILFQSEIRQVLEKVNPLKVIGFHSQGETEEWIRKFIRAVASLVKSRTGSLVIIERFDRVDEWITGGISIEGEPSPELLMSIFQKNSPLHDGAVIIRNGRVVTVACYLPLSSAENLPSRWGTRHRAALGISERCDALVIAVSEERGDITVASDGKATHVETIEQFSDSVINSILPKEKTGKTWKERLRDLVVLRWPFKLGILALVSILWLLLAGQQDFEVKIRSPLEITNLPENTEIVEPISPKVSITIRGLRKDASILNEENVRGEIDLSAARYGSNIFRVVRDQIILPNDRVQVVKIEPDLVEFRFNQIERGSGP